MLFNNLPSFATKITKTITATTTNTTNNNNVITTTSTSTTVTASNSNNPLILQAPNLNDVLFFNETGLAVNNSYLQTYASSQQSQSPSTTPSTPPQPIKQNNLTPTPIILKVNRPNRAKKKVTFPEDEKIKNCSDPPKRGWIPGMYSTSDLVDSYLKSCERHKCKPLNKLLPQLKALQDIDCSNGEKVNVLNLKSERLDTRQVESLEEVFKRLSFKTIDLDSSQFDDETSSATLFEILDYYDTCERLILANNRSINIMGWQSLSKYIRKTASLENLELRGFIIQELIYFTYLARAIRLTSSLKVIHLENSNIQGRYLIMLAAALKDNELIKEIYLGDNKIQPNDGQSISTIIKENKHLELLDLKNNNLQDIGLSHICSGLSEQVKPDFGLKALFIPNNGITANGITSYLSKALIHNRSLTSLNISQNTLTSEAIYDLKEALIVNKQISCLILSKIKLGDEGVIALAEYIAETQSLRRLDLRENDIRLGGLMALASSIKFNKTINILDLDRELKKENTIRDSAETARRLIQDINDYCMRNKRIQMEKEAEMKEMLRKQEEERRKQDEENERKLYEILNEINNDEGIYEEQQQQQQPNENDKKVEEEEEDLNDLDVIHHNELLKKILNNKTNAPYLLSPNDPINEEFQFIETTDLNNLLINKKEILVVDDMVKNEVEHQQQNDDESLNQKPNFGLNDEGDEEENEDDKLMNNCATINENENIVPKLDVVNTRISYSPSSSLTKVVLEQIDETDVDDLVNKLLDNSNDSPFSVNENQMSDQQLILNETPNSMSSILEETEEDEKAEIDGLKKEVNDEIEQNEKEVEEFNSNQNDNDEKDQENIVKEPEEAEQNIKEDQNGVKELDNIVEKIENIKNESQETKSEIELGSKQQENEMNIPIPLDDVNQQTESVLIEITTYLVDTVVNNLKMANIIDSIDEINESFSIEQENANNLQHQLVKHNINNVNNDNDNINSNNNINKSSDGNSSVSVLLNGSFNKSKNNNTIDEDDSDIEVLTVSQKNNNKNNNSATSYAIETLMTLQSKNNTQLNGKHSQNEKNDNLLSSIDENQDERGFKNESFEVDDLNYELLFEEKSSIKNCSTPKSNRTQSKQSKSLVDYSINDSSTSATNDNNNNKSNENMIETEDENSSSIIIASSPNQDILNQFEHQQHQIESNNQKPFFASKLTNSQLSEELSNEIGL